VKLLTITSLNGLTVAGLRLTTLPKPIAELEERGWKVHRRSGQLLFESPVTKDGKRQVFERPVAEFGLEWELEEGDDLGSVVKWSTGDEKRKDGKK
jgi:hypothetical protein